MSSELKLSGTTARVILQGNDSISSDQTFTFPDTGGEVATSPTGGSIVGYQQGVWTPTLNSKDDDNNYYVTTATYNEQWNGGWWTRVGNRVDFGGSIRLTNKGNVATNVIGIGGMPYTAVITPPDGPIPFGRSRSAMALYSPGAGLTNEWNDHILTCAITSSSGTGTNETPEEIQIRMTTWQFQLYGLADHTAANLAGDQITNLFYLAGFSSSYITDDTTWTPINGATIS